MGDRLDTPVGGEFDECLDVADIRVNAAVADQAQQVYRAVVVGGVAERVVERVVVAEAAVVDGVDDPGVGLSDDPARADVEMANLAVAHLALWEADASAMSAQRAERACLAQSVKCWCVGRPHRIAAVVIAESPAVKHDERASHVSAIARRGNDVSLCAGIVACRRRPVYLHRIPRDSRILTRSARCHAGGFLSIGSLRSSSRCCVGEHTCL